MTIRDNRLLWTLILSLAAYWSLGWYVPPLILSVSLSVFSVLTGLAIMFKYFQGFHGVLFKGERSPEEDGAHFAVIGIPAIAAAIVYGGMYSLAWNMAGNPESWVGTPASSFSRLLLVGGCIALYLTPDVQRHRFSLPSVAWLVLIMATAVLTAFLLGAYLGNDRLNDFQRLRPINYPECSSDRPVWVAANSTYYHDEQSPWRHRVVPRRCFRTAEEAIQAGYSPMRR